MPNSKKADQTGEIHSAPSHPHAHDSLVQEFGQKLAKDDFAGAAKCISAQDGDASLHARLASLLLIEIETRLEKSHINQAKKCLELLLKCAPEKKEEAHMWFADYHMGELQKILSTGGLASFGRELELVLDYAPQRKTEAHLLISQYYMNKLKKSMAEGRGSVSELKALRELLRYGPARREEAYRLFAERAMDEMRRALDDYDKEYAKIALDDFLKYAPQREDEAMAIWEQHMEASRKRKLYDILGVERTATNDEIRSAYRALAKRLHPDVNMNNPAAEEQMRHVNAAYAILGEPELRARYDQRGDRKERPVS